MKQIPINAFRFCKITVTSMVWLAFAFKSYIFLLLVLIILLLSALLKIKKAPMIIFYSFTIERLFPSRIIEVNESGLRFAHFLGASLSTICLAITIFFPVIGWWYVLGFAILKTISMLGFCPGEALYSCYKDGTCSIFRK